MDSVGTAGALFLTATLFGTMTAFSFLLAPLVFTQLPAETAGRFIRATFPWYYLAIIVLAAAGALAFVPGDPGREWTGAALLAGVAAVGVYTRQALMPAINRARDAQLSGDGDAGPRFDRLHRLSVLINFAQLAAVAAALWRFV